MRRSDDRTNGELFRAELGESVDHARRAAGYAAGGVKAAVGPAKDRVRGAARRVSGRAGWEEKKVSRRRVPRLAGLLVLGALTGAATAVILRRRRQRQWEEYDPADALAAEQAERAEQAEQADQASERV